MFKMRRSQRIVNVRKRRIESLPQTPISPELNELHNICHRYIFNTQPIDIDDVDALWMNVCKLRHAFDDSLKHVLTHLLFHYLYTYRHTWINRNETRFESFIIKELDAEYKRMNSEKTYMMPIMNQLHVCLTGF